MAFERRQYQQEVISDTITEFKRGQVNSILVESPTGSGKTFMGLSIVEQMRLEMHEDLLVVWVAMRDELLNQANRELKNFGFGVQIETLGMFNKKERARIAKLAENRPTIIVLDEAQHDAATNMTDIYKMIGPDYMLGLSATPYRADKAKLCFEKQIRNAGIRSLIHQGYLSQFDTYTIEDWTPERVVDTYFEAPERWGKSVMYFINTEQAARAYELLITRGARAGLVIGGQDDDNEKLIKGFRTGNLDVLVNCFILTEGFDCPELKTSFVRDSSKGPTMQMAGRAFRKHPDVPRKQVVQSGKTKWPIIRTANPVTQYIKKNGAWVTLQANENINEVSKAAVQAVIAHYQPLPEYFTKGKKKSVRR